MYQRAKLKKPNVKKLNILKIGEKKPKKRQYIFKNYVTHTVHF